MHGGILYNVSVSDTVSVAVVNLPYRLILFSNDSPCVCFYKLGEFMIFFDASLLKAAF